MKTSATLLILIVTASLAAQKQDKPQLADKQQRFALWFSGISSEFPDKETILFDVSGSPAHGFSRDQNLEFSASSIVGKLHKTKEDRMLLTRGTMSGNVHLVVTDANGVSDMTSSKATIEDDGSTATVVLPGSFNFSSTDTHEKGKRAMTLKASSGTFVFKSLATKNENPLSSARLNGPVTMTMNQVSKEGKEKLYTVTGDALMMRADGTDKIMTLTGNVHIVGEEQGGMLGDLTVSQATVTIDKNGDVKSIQSKGPGQGTISEKKGGS